jgi:formate dehydrogenase iron-sulfur subunit
MEATRPNGEPSLIHTLLAAQADLSAVDRFARRHDAGEVSASARRYRELLPAKPPGPGQQYAFEVDLDVCTGCKACVTGCHSLNGLDDGEVWRTVGLLHGGGPGFPALQTVTSSCHHCLEPACLLGCPANAYEKHPTTGIVQHLDDQCIGCSYCLFMCPFEAPKYQPARGIVRKCDMCSDRLAHGEAPACVESCPNQAIRIAIVEQGAAVEAAEAGVFLPGAPSPADTVPTTVYRTARPLPKNLLPADFHTLRPEKAHPSLTAMLVATQLSVGALAVDWALGAGRPSNAVIALAVGLGGLGASLLHLGRPRHAWRALLGLRTSWLSREILAFGVYAGLMLAYLAALAFRGLAPARAGLEAAAVATGLLGIACSVTVYAATRRAVWRLGATGARFGLCALALGAATVAATSDAPDPRLLALLAGAAATKLALDAAALRHLGGRPATSLTRRARLLAGPLAWLAQLRLACGALGVCLLLLLAALPGPGTAPLRAAILTLFLAGELVERHLFFVAGAAPRMPGAAAR